MIQRGAWVDAKNVGNHWSYDLLSSMYHLVVDPTAPVSVVSKRLLNVNSVAIYSIHLKEACDEVVAQYRRLYTNHTDAVLSINDFSTLFSMSKYSASDMQLIVRQLESRHSLCLDRQKQVFHLCFSMCNFSLATTNNFNFFFCLLWISSSCYEPSRLFPSHSTSLLDHKIWRKRNIRHRHWHSLLETHDIFNQRKNFKSNISSLRSGPPRTIQHL